MSAPTPDPVAQPHTVLGVNHTATDAEITTAYRRLVRIHHPDGPHPDRERLAAILTAYHTLRDLQHHDTANHQHPETSTPCRSSTIPVRVHRPVSTDEPDLRAGPVRRHPNP